MENSILEKEVNTYKIKIYADDIPSNPRIEWDNLGHMVCFHKKYNLGDKDNPYKTFDYESWEEMEKVIIKEEKAYIILPLYLYDHSGITISTTPFSCRFDSGQVGFIYITKDEILKEFSCKNITKTIKEKATNILKSEIKIYNLYLTGQVYGYIIDDLDGNNIDSCYGFFERPEKIIEYVEEEIISNYDYQLPLKGI